MGVHRGQRVGGVLVFSLVVFVAGCGGGGGGAEAPSVEVTSVGPTVSPTAPSLADEFKAFADANGTAAEKAASEHVQKVRIEGELDGFVTIAEITTDYSGGLSGPNAGSARLLVGLFADWKDARNGLVTVYSAAGTVLSNGNF
ncbi:hypothetical protein [Embleya sp. NBC_00896]|uniref:hypothetical protein n=1 Tax=Embleya sp. NBC_00896 TaxID=2975961 RepID=UPI003868790E|nr:hypothetical protein OG928_02460 [Embleya sp. NBC_00896]